jgi:hypothetical protein
MGQRERRTLRGTAPTRRWPAASPRHSTTRLRWRAIPGGPRDNRCSIATYAACSSAATEMALSGVQVYSKKRAIRSEQMLPLEETQVESVEIKGDPRQLLVLNAPTSRFDIGISAALIPASSIPRASRSSV